MIAVLLNVSAPPVPLPALTTPYTAVLSHEAEY